MTQITTTALQNETTIVTGGSRGIVEAFAGAGAQVITIARDGNRLKDLSEALPNVHGITFEAFANNFNPSLSPEIMGRGILDLVTGQRASDGTHEFMITGQGLHPLGH